LWEDNWDDDDIEDEFSTQLRFAILLHPLVMSSKPTSLSQGGTRKDKIELGPDAALAAKLSRTAYIRIPNLVVALLFVRIISIIPEQCLNTLNVRPHGRAPIAAFYVPVMLPNSAPRFQNFTNYEKFTDLYYLG